jgi:sugar phosphate isomerase/epimerase
MPPATAPVAAWVDSYRQRLKSALQSASTDGFRTVQAGATGELEPRELSRSAARHLTRYLRDLGLNLDALAVEFPGLGLADRQSADQRVDELRRTLALCAELRVPTAATRVCGFADESSRSLAEEMLGAVADLADRYGVAVAIQPGRDDPALLAGRLRSLDCPKLRIALDSGTGPLAPDCPTELAGLVGLVHLRDVRRTGGRVEEVPYGEGEVDFAALLGRLAEGGYAGALTIRRDAAAAGIDAMRQGRDYIEALLCGLTKR